MAHEIDRIQEYEKFSSQVDGLRAVDPANPSITADQAVALSELGSGLLNFASAAFPGAEVHQIYAKHYQREPQGRGAHFDVYGNTVHSDYPWLAVYNLSGKAAVSVAILPEDLAKSYNKRFPEPTEEAFGARRNYSSIALASEEVETYTGTLDKDTGMVILQRPGGPHVIHDVVPENPDNPGQFVKLARPADLQTAQDKIEQDGMVSLDELVTKMAREHKPETDEFDEGTAQTGSSLSDGIPPSGPPPCGPGLLD
jgi:hypothetical protein